MERQLASPQNCARVILAEAFERAIEMSCDRDAPAEFRFYMWSIATECLREGEDLEYGDGDV